ncbi:MAG: carboxylesterase family protein, partial [Clostridia bacterium]|nr:carboxylesterase family protein [Clostridia bacterium]
MLLVLLLAGIFLFLRLRILPGKAHGAGRLIWPGWILIFLGVFFLTWPPVKAVPAVAEKDPVRTEIISLPDGDVQGVVTADGAVEVFAGIPYAAPPVGELRWREPQDPESWEGVLAADHFAPM